jgi:hypothetical protein
MKALPLTPGSVFSAAFSRFERGLGVPCATERPAGRMGAPLMAAVVPGSNRLAARLRAASHSTAAVLAALAAGFGGEPGVAGKAALGRGHALAALAPGFGGPGGVVFKVSAACLAAPFGDFALLFLIHRSKAALRTTGLIAIVPDHRSSAKF